MAGSLFKYLPEQYVKTVLDGKILFRNLVYFKKIEDDPRADIFEGTHIDSPDNGIEITSVSTGLRTKGNFAFHNTLANPEKVFCFCTSYLYSSEQTNFGDACIEIFDREEFGRRLECALRRRHGLSRLETPTPFLLCDTVKYYGTNRAAPAHVDIKNPRHLPFLKREDYSEENEFRFVFARRNGYELKQRIVAENYSEFDEIKNLMEDQITIRIPSITDIARRVEP